MAEEETDDGWRFAVEDVGPEAEEEPEGDGGNVAGSLSPAATVERGTPNPENVFFVALGVWLMAITLASLVVSLDFVTVAWITGGVAVVAGLLYLFFTRA